MLTTILKAVFSMVSRLSLPRALALGRGLGWIYGSVIRYHRRDAFLALRRSLPEKSEKEIRQIVRRMYQNLGMNFVELCRLTAMTQEDLKNLVTMDGEEIVLEALKQKKGVIFLSAHLGNWDMLCSFAPRWGYPLTIITKNIKNKALNEYWMDIRQRFGLKFLPAHNSYRACLSALRKNELIGFILDQNMINTEGVFVDFFGKPACTTPGLAYMSAQSGAPVIPAFMIREGEGRHRVKILPVLEPPPDRKPETILRATQEYTKIIEQVIREHPEQWIWIHRRWRTVPPAEPTTDHGQQTTDH